MKRRKKILILTEWFAPGYKAGGPITSIVNLVNSIHDVDFFVITSDKDLNSDKAYEGIQPNEWTIYNNHTKVIYLDTSSLNNRFLGQLLGKIHFDVIYMNSMFSMWFTLMPLWWCSRRGHKEKVILAPRGMLKAGALSVKSRKKMFFLRLVRLGRFFNRITWHASSEAESQEIKSFFGDNATVAVVPNIPTLAIEALPASAKEKGQVSLITVARISPEKGMSEAVRFLDQTSLQGFSFEWKWFGPIGDESYFDECFNRLKQMTHVKFEYMGEISPLLISEIMKDAHFFYLPTRGENFGHSIAEALSLGKPVIISNKTPWLNLEKMGAGFDLELDYEPFERALRFAAEVDYESYAKLTLSARAYLMSVVHAGDVVRNTRIMFGIEV